MKRVASLYLPHWAIDRVRRGEPRPAPLPEAPAPDWLRLKHAADAERGGKSCDAPKNTGWRPGARWAREPEADARWAREPEADARSGRGDVQRRIESLPVHQRPPMRELGRRSEAAEMPFKRLPGDDGGKSSGWAEPARDPGPDGIRDPSPFAGIDPAADDRAAAAIARWRAMPAIRYPGEGPHPDKLARRGSNDPHAAPPGVDAFFDTGRSTARTLARVCPDAAIPYHAAPRDDAAPLVTVLKSGARIEIAAASSQAVALGIAPGMALTQARASVPGLDVRDADPAGDRADLERLAILLARRWCPVVAISGEDGAFLDITGVAHLHGGETRMGARIVRLLARFGFTARIAFADTAGAAWAAARHLCAREGRGAVCVLAPGAHRAALAALPVAALRIDAAAIELAHRLGVETIGDLAEMPRAPMVRRFGRGVAGRLDQAWGEAREPLDPVVPAAPIVVERRFAEPIATAEAIHHWLGGLVADLADALAADGLGARALALACTRVDASVQPLRIGLARPTRDAAHILRLIARRVEAIDPGYGIDALALHVLRADPLGAEVLDAALAGEATPDLAPLVDTLANRIGAARLWRIAPEESEVPERSTATRAPLDDDKAHSVPLRADDVRRLDASTRPDPWHPRWPRPARLLRRPERIDHVLAELPDYPPARFTWRGRTHRIVRGDGPERIFGEWWRRTSEREACRDYFRVEDDAGRRFWLFRRGDGRRPETGDLTWYLHGAFG